MSVACDVCQRVGHVVCKLCRLLCVMCVACMCLREECQRAYVIDGSGKDIIVLLYYTCTDTVFEVSTVKILFHKFLQDIRKSSE